MKARTSTDEETTARGLHLHWETRSPVVAPAWSGVLAELRAKPGQRLRDGDVVAVVDQIARTAVASRRPFTRPLALGASGDDVADLNAFLRRHGFEADAGSTFSNATWRGVNRFSASIGAVATPVFDPSWVLFLSTAEATVASASATVGAPAPGPGEVVVELEPELISARVIPVQAELAPTQDGSGAGSSPGEGAAPDGAAASAAAEVDRRLADVDAVEVPKGSVLRSGDVELALDPTRTAVAASALSAASAISDGGGYVEVTVVTPPGRDQIEVPAAAVYSDELGRSCVLVRRAGRAGGIPVQVVGGSSARTTVAGKQPGSLRIGDRVAVDVAAPDRTCR